MKIQFETLQATIELEQSPGLASVSGVDAGVVLTALAPFYGMYGHTYEIGDYVTDYDLWAGALRKLGDYGPSYDEAPSEPEPLPADAVS